VSFQLGDIVSNVSYTTDSTILLSNSDLILEIFKEHFLQNQVSASSKQLFEKKITRPRGNHT
jgi:hypothetical protein